MVSPFHTCGVWSPNRSTSSSTLGLIILLKSRYAGMHVGVSLCAFNLHFLSDKVEYLATHVLMYICVSLLVKISCPFLLGCLSFYSLIRRGAFYVLGVCPLSEILIAIWLVSSFSQ